jgi:hypothetical protein
VRLHDLLAKPIDLHEGKLLGNALLLLQHYFEPAKDVVLGQVRVRAEGEHRRDVRGAGDVQHLAIVGVPGWDLAGNAIVQRDFTQPAAGPRPGG